MHKPHVILAYPRYPSVTAEGIDLHRYFPRKTGRYSVRTGAPPVAEQIRDQIRSATGMHYGYRAPKVPAIKEDKPRHAPKPWELGHGKPASERVYLFLVHLAEEGLPIPSSTEIAEAVAAERQWVTDAWRLLSSKGKIRLRRDRQSQNTYHTAIQIVATGQIIRSVGAPDDMMP